MAQKTKQIIIAIIIIVVAFIAYKMFYTGNTSGDTTIAPDQATSQFVDGQAILALLDKLNKVKLVDTIFSDKSFQSLQSFEQPLEPQVFERKNPFLPIGVEDSGINGVLTVPKSTSTVKTR